MPKKKEDLCEGELTPLERRFVLELLKDGKRAKAAERAGCAGTQNTFKKLGYQMISRPHVKKAFDELQAESLHRAMVTKDTLINDIQMTIELAKRDKKYDAAFKGYGQLGEILGVLGKSKASNKDDDTLGNKTPVEEAFNQGDDEQDLNQDIAKYLHLVSSNNNNNKKK